MAWVTLNEGKGRVQIDLDADFFRGEAEPLQVHGAVYDLIQGHQTPLRGCFPDVQEQLPQDGPGAFRLLINLPHFLGPPGKLLTRQKPVRVAQNAGQRVAQFMRDSANHLAERREFLGLEELRVENALGGQVAVDLHAPQQPSDRVEDGPCRSLEDARRWVHQLQLLANTALDCARQFPPALREQFRFRRMTLEAPDQSLQGLDFPGLFRRSEEHTSELQSQFHLVCRLLLEKKK